MTDSFVTFALGLFRFSMRGANYDRLTHRLTERWEEVDRAGGHPALHWAGHGAETVTLSGVIFPHHAGSLQLVAEMRIEARRGTPLRMTDGAGFFWGSWVILDVTERQSDHLADGAPRRQAYSLTLQRYVEAERSAA